jgi:hypothetical protein
MDEDQTERLIVAQNEQAAVLLQGNSYKTVCNRAGILSDSLGSAGTVLLTALVINGVQCRRILRLLLFDQMEY